MRILFYILFLAPAALASKPPPRLPNRIVVLSPALTEIVFELGKGDRIVGTTEFADYPEAAKKIPRVGSYVSPSLEKILSLKPRAVLQSEEGVDNLSEPLKKAGIETVTYKMKSLRDYADVVSNLSLLFGSVSLGRPILKKWNEDWQKVEAEKSHHKVVVQVDHDPIFIAGSQTFLSELVEKCGATNDLNTFIGFKQPTLERLTKVSADVILVTAQIKDDGFKKRVEEFWDKQPLNPKPKVLFFDPDKVSRLTSRLPIAALELCKSLKAAK